jgi:hypothetical protein
MGIPTSALPIWYLEIHDLDYSDRSNLLSRRTSVTVDGWLNGPPLCSTTLSMNRPSFHSSFLSFPATIDV